MIDRLLWLTAYQSQQAVKHNTALRHMKTL